MGVNQALGKVRNERGTANEYKVLEGIQESSKKPEWYVAARHATREEDDRGIDLIVTTDVGDVYLQVKSSKFRAEQFKRKIRKQMIGMIVVKVNETIEQLGPKAFKEVGRLRSLILHKRRNS